MLFTLIFKSKTLIKKQPSTIAILGILISRLPTMPRFYLLCAASAIISAPATAASVFAPPTMDSTPKVCPANHQMYYVGSNPPPDAISAPLTWTDGQRSQDFSFDLPNNDKNFSIKVTELKDVAPDTRGFRASPFYGDINNATVNAINFVHTSSGNTANHTIEMTINKPVSKMGLVIQDIDSTGSVAVPSYLERIDVSMTNGKLLSTANNHDINANFDILTAIASTNCDLNGCSIDAIWGYKPTNTPFRLVHSNTADTTNDSLHAAGYSDFYFCLAPPKLILKKALVGPRVNAQDQFNLTIANSQSPTNSIASFITQGSGSTIATGSDSSGVVELEPNQSYILSESIVGGGSIGRYDSSYSCTNQTSSSSTNLPSGGTGRSFTLANLTYGDEVICTITNSPKSFTFSGTVFNDNGGISDVAADPSDLSATYTDNPDYFDGAYNPTSGETGLTGSTITLDKCAGSTSNSSFSPRTTSVAADGSYQFTLTASSIGDNTKLCFTQNEPDNYGYTVDTTANTQEVVLTSDQYNYSQIDFGDVIADHTALVLVKRQHINDCSITSLGSVKSQDSLPPTQAFSTQSVSDIDPSQCIAYRIAAINRGNVELTDVVITDPLQSANNNGATITSVLTTPKPTSYSSDNIKFASNSVKIGQNGSVITQPFSLATDKKDGEKVIFFNTQYDQ